MYEHTLFIGMNDKDTHKQELSLDEFKKELRTLLAIVPLKKVQRAIIHMTTELKLLKNL